MKKKKRKMPLINFKGIIGEFVSLDVITNKFYADRIPYCTYAQYELTIKTNEGYKVKVEPIKQEDAERIMICLQCSRGKKVKCWRGLCI